MKMNLFQKILFVPHNIISFLNLIFGIPIIILLIYFLTNLNWVLWLIPIYIGIDFYKDYIAKKQGGKGQLPIYKFNK